MVSSNTVTNSASSSAVKVMRIGIIGVGNISPAYIQGCRAFDALDLVACADIDTERAKKVAAEHNIPRALSVDELLADPDIDIVINLTIPAVHAEVSLRAIEAGKHVYSEKPLATTLEDGQKVMAAAKARGVMVGCAPDTFLFSQHQTCRHAIDQGAIGRPLAAVGFMASHGPEKWHPNPDFFYKPGAGPMFDMGPYYVTCLVNLLGAVTRVSGAATVSMPTRISGTGREIPVTVPTHYTGVLEFESGAVATLIISFDMWGNHLPQMEIYGETGSITVPDPNGFEPREVRLDTPDVDKANAWAVQSDPFREEWARGIGLADMAEAIQAGRPFRANGDLALHVLEVMSAFETAYKSGQYVSIANRVERPEALPVGLPPRRLSV